MNAMTFLGGSLLGALALLATSAAAAPPGRGARVSPPPRVCPGGCPPDAGPAWSPGAFLRIPPAAWRSVCLTAARTGPREDRSLDKTLVQRTVRARAGQVRWCYQKALLGRPDLAGDITLKLTIGADGAVRSASLDRTTLADPGAERCIVERARGWRFPAVPGAAPITIRYPFHLMGEPLAGGPGARRADAPPSVRDCPVRTPSAPAAEAIARLEARIESLPEGDPDRVAALRELAARYVGQADRIEERAADELWPRLDDLWKTGGAPDGGDRWIGACDAAGRAALERALATFERVAVEDPAADDADTTLYATALLAGEVDRPDDAAARLDQLLTRFPTTRHAVRAHFLLAELRFDRGRCGDAVPHFEAAAKGDAPELAWVARHRLAWCRLRAGDFDAAREQLVALARDLRATDRGDRGLLHDVERDILLAWSESGDPGKALELLRTLDEATALKQAARLAALYESHGAPEAAARVYRTLLTAGAPLPARLPWWRDLVVALLRAGDDGDALAELASGLDVLSEAGAPDGEGAAWADLLEEVAVRIVGEAAKTHDPAAIRRGRAVCGLLGAHRGLALRLDTLRVECGAFLTDVARDPRAAVVLLGDVLAQAEAPEVRARAAFDLADARRVLLACVEGEPAVPKTDDLGLQEPTAAESAFIAATERAVALGREALPPKDHKGLVLLDAVDAARVLYDRNRFSEAVPRLEAIVRDDKGWGAARKAAPLLLSACQLACDRACLERWNEDLAEREDLASDELAGLLAWWRAGGSAALRVRCE